MSSTFKSNDIPIADILKNIEQGSLASHLIDVEDLKNDSFNEYFILRAKSLLNLISSAMGKPITNLNGEDVVKAFGKPLD